MLTPRSPGCYGLSAHLVASAAAQTPHRSFPSGGTSCLGTFAKRPHRTECLRCGSMLAGAN